jgi:hypothetical protein
MRLVRSIHSAQTTKMTGQNIRLPVSIIHGFTGAGIAVVILPFIVALPLKPQLADIFPPSITSVSPVW